ncbi:hypothetical protein SAMN05421595_2616 [Austwickia chelonae]|nr:hypothetical protein [Austwickia chelonae]SEW38137.1 hypothetical protein SAMN05421595_2616 [Austwickia chelonae]
MKNPDADVIHDVELHLHDLEAAAHIFDIAQARCQFGIFSIDNA